MIIDPNVVKYIIRPYLTYADMNILSQVNKSFRSVLSIKLSEFEEKLIDKINKITKSNIGCKLIKLIKKYKDTIPIQIGGSILNQIIHNEDYYSDINIFVEYDVEKLYYTNNQIDELRTIDYIRELFFLLEDNLTDGSFGIKLYYDED